MIYFWGILFIMGSYFLGAIPVGYLLTKAFTGKNILAEGSGNVGSTNVGRVAGRRISILTQILDMLKGFIPVSILLLFEPLSFAISFTPYYIYIVALSSIIGHDFSIFLGFRGGKGVNTTLGASILISPYAVFVSVAAYYLVKKTSKYVSVGSLALAVVLPLSHVLINGLNDGFYYLCCCAVLIIIMHSENIKRLMRNKEVEVQG